MFWKQTATCAALAATLAAAPFSHAEAHRGHFPLFWPFFAGAAVVGTAAAIVTAPFRYPYYGYGYGYYAPPAGYYPPPAAYPPGYYNGYYNGYYPRPY